MFRVFLGIFLRNPWIDFSFIYFVTALQFNFGELLTENEKKWNLFDFKVTKVYFNSNLVDLKFNLVDLTGNQIDL